jgi:hypothetical protein
MKDMVLMEGSPAPQNGSDPRNEFSLAKWFRNVVVGTGL